MRKRAVSERKTLPKSTPWLRSVLTCTIAALALGASAISAHALNGTSGEFADTEGLFQALCQDLRTATGLPGGDVIFACDPNGEQCHLVSGGTAVDQGSALGFCADSVADAVRPYRPRPDALVPLEENVVVRGTTFGTDIGHMSVAGSAGDVFCETFENTATSGTKKTTPSPGKRVCVNVFAGRCTGTNCGAGDGSIVVRRDTCNTVRQILAASVTGDAFQNIAYWLFIDVDKTGQKGSEVLSVCPGFAWNFLPLSGPVAAVKYQANQSLIQKPGCFKKVDGSWCCYCTAPTRQCWTGTKYLCDDDAFLAGGICDGL
jgi:hypothetical protein